MFRILLFLLTNFGILLVLSVSMRLLGIDTLLEQQGGGLNLTGLLIFAAIFGMGGAFISLSMSRWLAKKSMGVHVIESPASSTEQWLVSTIQKLSHQAGISMPEVGIFNSSSPNAFATGMNRNAALVAVSTGLLKQMNQDEVEAVLGHEVSHVANGDMVTLTLIQGVVNTFVIFFSRIIGYFVDRVIFKIERGHGPGFWIGTIRRLQAVHNESLPDEMAAFGISGTRSDGFRKLFMSHPPLDERIHALEAGMESS